MNDKAQKSKDESPDVMARHAAKKAAEAEKRAKREADDAAYQAHIKGIKLKVSGQAFREVAKFAAKADIRYYLNGVHVEPCKDGGVFLVATDGCCLLAMHEPTGELTGTDDGAIFPVTDEIIAAIKLTKAERKEGVPIDTSVVCHDGILRVMKNAIQAYLYPGECVVPGKFPDWRRLMPDAESLQPGRVHAVNPELIGRFKHLKRTSFSDGIRVYSSGSQYGAMFVQMVGRDDVIGVVMPIRDDATVDGCKKAMGMFTAIRAEHDKAKAEAEALAKAEAEAKNVKVWVAPNA